MTRWGLNKLIFAVNEDVLRSLFQDHILMLVEYDTEHCTNLVNDLEVFLINNGNLGEAAKSIYIHRNTLMYRMKKVEEITGKSLNDFTNRVGFYIAIITKKHLSL